MRLIDADDLIENLDTAYMEQTVDADPIKVMRMSLLKEFAKDIVNAAPTVDAVPAVRCKDCRHWLESSVKNYGQCDCDALMQDAEFFCANAERKDNV